MCSSAFALAVRAGYGVASQQGNLLRAQKGVKKRPVAPTLECGQTSDGGKRDTIPPAFSMNSKPKTILIVDDDEGMRDTLNAILRRDYRVLRAATGEAALAILNREDVDLMLLDVRLPGIDGFDVLRIVKENYSLIEVHHDIGHQRDRDRREGDEVRRLPLRDQGLRLRDDPIARP